MNMYELSVNYNAIWASGNNVVSDLSICAICNNYVLRNFEITYAQFANF